MGSRDDLQALLESILGSDKVYFQPPESVKLSYPCVVYSRELIATIFANDEPFMHHFRYEIKVIDPDPDSSIPMKLARLTACKFDRHYTSNNLNHDVFTLYY